MAYNYITNRTSPNRSAGRGGAKINEIVIHHWGDPKNKPTFEGVVNWLCNPAAQVSAHYVVTGVGRRVAHIVNNWDTAWHAGSFPVNQRTIGIECDPQATNADYDVLAELVANLWKAYGKLPLAPHKKYINTACPGRYDLARIKREAEAKLSGVKNATHAEVEKLFKELLNRSVDSSGVNTYVNKMPAAQVRASILKSPEYVNRQARLKAEAARKAADEAANKAEAAKKAEQAKLQAEALKKAEKAAKLEQANRDRSAAERAEALAQENNSLLKQILALIKSIFNR